MNVYLIVSKAEKNTLQFLHIFDFNETITSVLLNQMKEIRQTDLLIHLSSFVINS